MTKVVKTFTKRCFIISKTGSDLNLVTIDGNIEVTNEWQEVYLTENQIKAVIRNQGSVSLTYNDPRQKVVPTRILGITASEQFLKIIEGNKKEVKLFTVPSGGQFPSEITSISNFPAIASCTTGSNIVIISGHKEGKALITNTCGNFAVKLDVTVVPVPKFRADQYIGSVNQPIELEIVGQDLFKIQPQANIEQKHNAVIISAPGTYKVTANVLGVTCTTTIIVE